MIYLWNPWLNNLYFIICMVENATGNGLSIKAKGAVCRLENIRDILNIIFRDGGKSHAKFYRVSRFFTLHFSFFGCIVIFLPVYFYLVLTTCYLNIVYLQFHVQESKLSADSIKGKFLFSKALDVCPFDS